MDGKLAPLFEPSIREADTNWPTSSEDTTEERAKLTRNDDPICSTYLIFDHPSSHRCLETSRLLVVVFLDVLPKQVLAVVITIGGTDDDMDVLADGAAARVVLPHSHGSLMIKFNENHGAVDSVVENGVVARIAYPGEMGFI